MRVIAGIAHGTRLSTLPGEDITRPTIDRVKEAMFSSVQFLLEDSRVLDLFGGSGQLGIEAVSRGAAHCDVVDSNSAAIRIIAKNWQAAGLQEWCTIRQCDAKSFLAGAPKGGYHLAFLDPPYRMGIIAEILPALAPAMAVNGVVLCETEPEAELPLRAGGLVRKKQYKYGKVLVTRYCKEDDSE